jgi:SAM-dependent methyltransferase
MIVYEFVIDIVSKQTKIGGRIIDFGCGDGLYSKPLTQAGFKYIGVDQTPRGGPFIVSDIRSTPLKDNCADTIFGVASFYFAGPGAFEEAYRLLDKNGRLIIFDYKKRVLKKIDKLNPDLNVFTWSKRDLFDALERCGFKSSREVSYSYPFNRLRLFSYRGIKSFFFSSWVIIVADK